MNKEKHIAAIIAFSVTFIFATGLVRLFIPPPLVSERAVVIPNNLNAEALEEFIFQDELNGWVRQSNENRAASVAEYYNASSRMDASRFSPEFQRAWAEHMKAWQQMARFENNLPVEGNLNKYRLDGDIDRTWEKVLQVAKSEGARIRD